VRSNGPLPFSYPALAGVLLLLLAAARFHPFATEEPTQSPPSHNFSGLSEFRDRIVQTGRHLLADILVELLEQDDGGLDEAGLVARLLDPATPAPQLRADAWRLAQRYDSPSAAAALWQVLAQGSADQRAAAAEALGKAALPGALQTLEQLLADPDGKVRRGALSGLARMEQGEATALLRRVLADPLTPPDLRAYSAGLLGDAGSAAGLQALKAAAAQPLEEDTLAAVIDGLGNYRFRDTAEVFRGILADPSRDVLFKAEAVEALARSDADALPFLLETAATGADPEVRAAAAWAAGASPHGGGLGQQLTGLLRQEADSEVRRRLYESIMRQRNIGSPDSLEQAYAESDPATRIAGANALAVAIRREGPASPAAARFGTEQIPDLVAAALGDGERNLRYRAVFALSRAGSADAVAALQAIAAHADPEIAGLATRGLASQSNRPVSNP